jgi:hypothetical protein
MAESLDGNRIIDGNPRHGVGYRSSRHFDILNENMVFVWRNQFFNYRTFAEQTTVNANRSTGLLWGEFDKRKNAFELSPILLNLTSHDEIFPTDDQWSLAYAHAITTVMDGVPMVFYGQEMGAQNDILTYGARTDFSAGISANNNFALYETNFGKSIPNFKRYNNMTKVWAPAGWKDSLRGTYARLNMARLNSPALRSQQNYFLPDRTTNTWNNDIFAVAKIQSPGVSAAQQDVVFAFVNNNFRVNDTRNATFSINATTSTGANWFGIQSNSRYNVVDLASANATRTLWDNVTPGNPGILGSKLIADGIYVGFQGGNASFTGSQVQYLRLIDITAGKNATSVNNYTGPSKLPAPVISSIGNRFVQPGQSVTFTVSVSANQTDTVGLDVASNLSPLKWNFNESAVFTFTPSQSDIGTHTFRFTATGQDGFDEETFTITVSEAQSPYDAWLTNAFGNTYIQNNPSMVLPNSDPDNDGNPNLVEFHLGTNPLDTSDRLKTRILGVGNGTISLEVSPFSQTGQYFLQESVNLSSGWETPTPLAVEGGIPGDSGELSAPTRGLKTFYRIIYQAPEEN